MIMDVNISDLEYFLKSYVHQALLPNFSGAYIIIMHHLEAYRWNITNAWILGQIYKKLAVFDIFTQKGR